MTRARHAVKKTNEPTMLAVTLAVLLGIGMALGTTSALWNSSDTVSADAIPAGDLSVEIDDAYTYSMPIQGCATDEAAVDQSVPSRIIDITASGNSSFALDDSGNVWAWGDGQSGQFGNGELTRTTKGVTASTSGVPGRVDFGPCPPHITDIQAESNSSVIATDGIEVWQWGGGTATPTKVDPSTLPNPAFPQPSGFNSQTINGVNVVNISPGQSHFLVLVADGTVYAWGDDASKQLGRSSDTAHQNDPVPVCPPGWLDPAPCSSTAPIPWFTSHVPLGEKPAQTTVSGGPLDLASIPIPDLWVNNSALTITYTGSAHLVGDNNRANLSVAFSGEDTDAANVDKTMTLVVEDDQGTEVPAEGLSQGDYRFTIVYVIDGSQLTHSPRFGPDSEDWTFTIGTPVVTLEQVR